MLAGKYGAGFRRLLCKGLRAAKTVSGDHGMSQRRGPRCHRLLSVIRQDREEVVEGKGKETSGYGGKQAAGGAQAGTDALLRRLPCARTKSAKESSLALFVISRSGCGATVLEIPSVPGPPGNSAPPSAPSGPAGPLFRLCGLPPESESTSAAREYRYHPAQPLS